MMGRGASCPTHGRPARAGSQWWWSRCVVHTLRAATGVHALQAEAAEPLPTGSPSAGSRSALSCVCCIAPSEVHTQCSVWRTSAMPEAAVMAPLYMLEQPLVRQTRLLLVRL